MLAQGSERLAIAQAYANGISDARGFQQQRASSGRGGSVRGGGRGRGGTGRGRGRGFSVPALRIQGPFALPKPGQSDMAGNGSDYAGHSLQPHARSQQGEMEGLGDPAASPSADPRPKPALPQGQSEEPSAKRPRIAPPSSGRGMPTAGIGLGGASRGPWGRKAAEERAGGAEEGVDVDPSAVESLRDRIEFFRAKTPAEFDEALQEVREDWRAGEEHQDQSCSDCL